MSNRNKNCLYNTKCTTLFVKLEKNETYILYLSTQWARPGIRGICLIKQVVKLFKKSINIFQKECYSLSPMTINIFTTCKWDEFIVHIIYNNYVQPKIVMVSYKHAFLRKIQLSNNKENFTYLYLNFFVSFALNAFSLVKSILIMLMKITKLTCQKWDIFTKRIDLIMLAMHVSKKKIVTFYQILSKSNRCSL